MNLLVHMQSDWQVCILLSWPAIHFSGSHSDGVGESWWGRNGESRIPGFPGPQTPWLSLVIVYNFCVSCFIPHAVFLSLKSLWGGENAEHPCIVSSTVPAMLYIDMSCYYIYKYIYNFVRFLHLRSSRILYFFLFCLSCFLYWSFESSRLRSQVWFLGRNRKNREIRKLLILLFSTWSSSRIRNKETSYILYLPPISTAWNISRPWQRRVIPKSRSKLLWLNLDY